MRLLMLLRARHYSFRAALRGCGYDRAGYLSSSVWIRLIFWKIFADSDVVRS